MTNSGWPVFESRFFVEPESAGEFESWLLAHVESAQQEEAVEDCRYFRLPDDDQGRSGYVCQYTLQSDAAIDDFLDGFGSDAEAEAETQFSVLFSSRLLREDRYADTAPAENPDCLNCGTRLRGQYCEQCGQRSSSRLISLGRLIGDAFGDIFDVDSRLWNTIVPLLLKPGLITRDYLSGRRARYMPPFRTYLVLSLLFFLVAFFDPGFEFNIETGTDVENTDTAADPDNDMDCDSIDPEQMSIPAAVSDFFSKQELQQLCEKMNQDRHTIPERLVDHAPTALIVLLPLMALVLLLLYPLSRRYYVEHLLFIVHLHAFAFLLLTLQILIRHVLGWVAAPDFIAPLLIAGTTVYMPVYTFIAMRRVYKQSRLLTTLKYCLFCVAYALGFSIVMLGATITAALSG